MQDYITELRTNNLSWHSQTLIVWNSQKVLNPNTNLYHHLICINSSRP
jgi:hypothetical protein